ETTDGGLRRSQALAHGLGASGQGLHGTGPGRRFQGLAALLMAPLNLFPQCATDVLVGPDQCLLRFGCAGRRTFEQFLEPLRLFVPHPSSPPGRARHRRRDSSVIASSRSRISCPVSSSHWGSTFGFVGSRAWRRPSSRNPSWWSSSSVRSDKGLSPG